MRVILLAGGTGERFDPEVPKQFARLAGEPILSRTLRAVEAANPERIVIVAPRQWLALTRELAGPHLVVEGGPTRTRSTLAGLWALPVDDEPIVVHDAVRPLVTPGLIRRSVAPIEAGEADAVDTVIPSADTLVIVDGSTVTDIPDRARYRRGQTPQAFRGSVLRAAYAAGDLDATDDCTLVRRHVPGARIVAIPGEETNVKITTPLDLVIADRILQSRSLAALSDAGSLAGQSVYVIGGTAGIGEAIADEAARLGARVTCDSRRTGVDVREPACLAERMAAIQPDHVICTAGILRAGPFVGTAFEDIVAVNLTGSLNVARAAQPYLRGGSLTLFASSAFTLGRAGQVAYAATKAAIVNAAQGLAAEWWPEIRVNAVSPARTDTALRRGAFPGEAGLLQPSAVAAATLRLVGSDLTGQVLDVR